MLESCNAGKYKFLDLVTVDGVNRGVVLATESKELPEEFVVGGDEAEVWVATIGPEGQVSLNWVNKSRLCRYPDFAAHSPITISFVGPEAGEIAWLKNMLIVLHENEDDLSSTGGAVIDAMLSRVDAWLPRAPAKK